jgi:hypothetical protein
MGRKPKICLLNRIEFENEAKNHDSMTSLVMYYANILKDKLDKEYDDNTHSYIIILYIELKKLYKNDYTRIIHLKNSIITSGAIISYLKVTIHSHYGADITKAIAKSIK